MRQALLTLAVWALAYGQTVETPVSFDAQGRVFKLTPELNRAASVFPEVSDFDHLEIWQTDTVFRLEVYQRDGTRQSRLLTQADLDVVRRRMESRAVVVPPVLDQEGRGRFLFEQLPIALGWYGTSVVIILQPQDARTGAGVYLLSSAAGYFLPLMWTSHVRLTNAQAHQSVSFGYRGILGGFLLSDVFQVHGGDDGPRWNAIFMLGTSVAGQFTGRALADKLTLGQSTLVTNYTDLGTLGGALTGLIVTWTAFRDDFNSTPLSALTLLGMAGGVIAGNRRAQHWNCTEGQVIADRAGGLVGALVLPALYYAATGAQLLHRDGDGADLEVLSALAIGGAVAGTWWTESRLRELPLSTSSGYIVAGTAVGGGLVGAGLGFVLNTSEPERRWVAATTAAGGLAGFLGGLRLVQGLEPAARTDRARFRLELNHGALLGAVAEYASRRSFRAPGLVTLSF